LWLGLLLWGKLRRVLPRLWRPRLWDRRTGLGVLAVAIVALALGSGVWWVAGGSVELAGFGLLNWHILLGFVITAVVGLHTWARAKRLRRRDLRGRRQALRFGLLVAGAALLWPTQQAIQRALNVPGTQRRFTGSREAGSFAGNAFPATSWVADAPRSLDLSAWTLRIDGAVAVPVELTYDEVDGAGDELEATLDCTSGFYSTQRWQGARIGQLLERAQVRSDASWVSVVSVTGYRWCLPIEEAHRALLATRVGGESLSHDHGAPARLVAPGRRGFQWVKWVVRLELRTAADPGELVAIHTSSFTPAGRGEG
jgi:DMSO/TMAO reductase YedYZ molybdopterin-dependent catalytic subunit